MACCETKCIRQRYYSGKGHMLWCSDYKSFFPPKEPSKSHSFLCAGSTYTQAPDIFDVCTYSVFVHAVIILNQKSFGCSFIFIFLVQLTLWEPFLGHMNLLCDLLRILAIQSVNLSYQLTFRGKKAVRPQNNPANERSAYLQR